MAQNLLKILRLASDPTRARLLLVLEQEELSVAELQEILAKGQSQISTHLAQLKQAGLITDRREGKNAFYRLAPSNEWNQLFPLLQAGLSGSKEGRDDRAALGLVLAKRQDRVRAFFDDLAGRFGRTYLPGRSWQGLAEALLAFMPPLVIADLGAGEGTFSQILARRARRVIAIDSSEKMVQVGANLAHTNGLTNLDFRQGDMELVPIGDGEVDIAFFSQALHHAQHPKQAVSEAWRILRPGGRIVVLDLLRHQFEQARELYADVWLGFTEVELRRFLEECGFSNVQSSVVHREAESPHFETLLAHGHKAADV